MKILRDLLKSLNKGSLSEGSLTQKVVKGGVWIFGLRMSRRLLDFIRTVILARFLAPNDFGLMGIALLTIQTLEAFSQTGFQAALVQKKNDIKDYLNNVWTVLFLRGLLLCFIIMLSAPAIARFFNTQQAVLLIQIVGLSFLVQGATNIGIVFFQKQLDFGKQYWYEFSGVVADFLVSIILVFVIRNVWALVGGKLAGELTRLIASYILDKFRPKFEFCWRKIKELHEFGRWISGINILVFLVTQGDSIIVGKIFGPISLGFYKLASTIANLPSTEITQVISQVTFPAYAQFQDDKKRLKKGFKKALLFTFLLSASLTFTIMILIRFFTRIFLGSKWLPIVSITQVLVLAGFVRSIQAIPGPIFQAMGKPQIDTFAQVVRICVFFIAVLLLIPKSGMMGVAYGVLISIFFTFLFSYYFFFLVLKQGKL